MTDALRLTVPAHGIGGSATHLIFADHRLEPEVMDTEVRPRAWFAALESGPAEGQCVFQVLRGRDETTTR